MGNGHMGNGHMGNGHMGNGHMGTLFLKIVLQTNMQPASIAFAAGCGLDTGGLCVDSFVTAAIPLAAGH
eukprot:COSAG03_NODE_947_length_5233_cov_13.433385_7_plen_69_part_00